MEHSKILEGTSNEKITLLERWVLNKANIERFSKNPNLVVEKVKEEFSKGKDSYIGYEVICRLIDEGKIDSEGLNYCKEKIITGLKNDIVDFDNNVLYILVARIQKLLTLSPEDKDYLIALIISVLSKSLSLFNFTEHPDGYLTLSCHTLKNLKYMQYI